MIYFQSNNYTQEFVESESPEAPFLAYLLPGEI